MEKQIQYSPDALVEKVGNESYFQTVYRRFKRHKLGYISMWFLLLMFVLIILIPLLSPYSMNASVGANSERPSFSHWMGTDQTGRDVFTRLFYGAGISLLVSLSATFISTVIGILLGLLSGYFGGWIDIVIMRITDIVMSFPYLLLVLVVAKIFDPGLINIILILGFVDWPAMARLVRSNVMSIREANFVQGSKVSGMPHLYIMLRDILPNTMAPVLVNATSVMAITMLDEAALSYLGMGVLPPTPSLGNLLNVANSISVFRNMPWMWLPPGIMIVMLVVAINFVGDALRDAFDPKS